MIRSVSRRASALALIVLSGCASVPKESAELIEQGRWREGLARLDQGLKDRPNDPELRIQYFRMREQTINRVLLSAGADAAAGRLDSAADTYQQILVVDPNNVRASAGLAAIEAARRHSVLAADARTMLDKGDAVSADLLVKGILTENPEHSEARNLDRELRKHRKALTPPTPPTLKSRMQKPVNLEFRDAPLKLVLEAMSRSAGINFVFDRDVRPDLKTTIFVKDLSVEDAIDMMLAPNQLEKKLLSENTILVFPNTPQKLRENQELVMRAFHLGNADPTQTINLIRTMIKTKDLFIDERVNLLFMRDTPDAIRLAEKLITMQDLAEPEVLLELEILEVSRNKMRDLGLTYPTEFAGPGGTLATIKQLDSANIAVNTGYKIKLLRTDGETKTLANPRVRVRNKEKARIHVGDRVPVISSSIVGTGPSSAPVTTEQIQYLDVGIKVDAEPIVHSDDTVTVRINLDVSSLGAQTRTNAGTTAYQVGTRNVSTVLRLRDGETQALMGLIRDDDVKTSAGIPFLGELPLLDRIFGTTKTDRSSKELVLLITPQIIRGLGQPNAALAEFWSGTEAALRVRAPFVQAIEVGGQAPQAKNEETVGGATIGRATPAVAPLVPLSVRWSAPAKAKTGSEVSVSLVGRSEGALKSATVQLRYNPIEFNLVAVEDGGFFKKPGTATVFVPRIEPALGMISVTLGVADTSSVKGEGNLITLRLKPVTEAPTAQVQITAVVGVDEANRQVPVEGVVPLDLAIEP